MIDPTIGAFFCNQCHSKRCGDGFAAIMRATGCNFPDAVRMVAEYLGLSPEPAQPHNPYLPKDLILHLANLKGCTREGLAEYGAEVDHDRVIFPVYGADRLQCSSFTIWPMAPAGDRRLKGLLAKGKPSGMFFPYVDQGVHYPVPGETWIVCEGVKDAAAWYSLGYYAAGACGEELVRRKFVFLFTGVNVILAPDRTMHAESLAKVSANCLYNIAASVRICHLPLPIVDKEAADNAKR